MICMRLLATFSCAALVTFGVRAQGLISSINRTSYVGNEAGGGPVPNREIGFDHVSDPGFTNTNPPSLNPVTGIFSMTISTNEAGRTFFANAIMNCASVLSASVVPSLN